MKAGERRSWLALAAGVLGVLAVVDAAGGAALAHFGFIRPAAGYELFRLGVAEAALGVLVALAAFARTGVRSQRTGRPLAWLGLLASAGVLLVLAAIWNAGRGFPSLYDVTTNFADPPAFVAALGDPGNAGQDLAYLPSSRLEQSQAYPDIAPIRVATPPAETIAAARRAAEAIGLEVTDERPPAAADGEGALEAREASRVFRFVDDFVVRVRPTPDGGSVVDVRSRSRLGKADFGVNARRIRAFKSALTRSES
ncbi:MAG TPA: DUF1499 domain-containing protein [Myxococcota bacterium]|nr:DUF1499 domain-containing protein [Myxococcota bacterium]